MNKLKVLIISLTFFSLVGCASMKKVDYDKATLNNVELSLLERQKKEEDNYGSSQNFKKQWIVDSEIIIDKFFIDKLPDDNLMSSYNEITNKKNDIKERIIIFTKQYNSKQRKTNWNLIMQRIRLNNELYLENTNLVKLYDENKKNILLHYPDKLLKKKEAERIALEKERVASETKRIALEKDRVASEKNKRDRKKRLKSSKGLLNAKFGMTKDEIFNGNGPIFEVLDYHGLVLAMRADTESSVLLFFYKDNKELNTIFDAKSDKWVYSIWTSLLNKMKDKYELIASPSVIEIQSFNFIFGSGSSTLEYVFLNTVDNTKSKYICLTTLRVAPDANRLIGISYINDHIAKGKINKQSNKNRGFNDI